MSAAPLPGAVYKGADTFLCNPSSVLLYFITARAKIRSLHPWTLSPRPFLTPKTHSFFVHVSNSCFIDDGVSRAILEKRCPAHR